MRKTLSLIPSCLLGTLFLYLAFANIADLSELQNQLARIAILFWSKGACLVMIPGLQLTLGLLLVSNSNQWHAMRKAAAITAFLFFLTALIFAAHAALTHNPGCGTCGQLARSKFDIQVWKPVGIYLLAMTTSVTSLFVIGPSSKSSEA